MLMPDAITSLMGPPGPRLTAIANQMRQLVTDSARPLIHRLRDLDARSYLPGAVLTKVDRMTMAHSLEARSPFLDPTIAEFARSLPDQWCATAADLKILLREVVRKRLPPEWAARPKRGFGLPSAGWSQADMISMCDELLCAPDARCHALLDRNALDQWVNDQRDERRYSVLQVWTMLMLELWWRAHEEKKSPVPTVHTTPMATPVTTSQEVS
jgi:asparagine synthase (glutamine-hydrolysing)